MPPNDVQLTRKGPIHSGFRAQVRPGLGRSSPELASQPRPMSGPHSLTGVQKTVLTRGNDVRFSRPELDRTWAVAGTPESRPEPTPATPAVPIGPELTGRSSNRAHWRLTPRSALLANSKVST